LLAQSASASNGVFDLPAAIFLGGFGPHPLAGAFGVQVLELLGVQLDVEFQTRPLGKTPHGKVVLQEFDQRRTVFPVDLLAGGLDELLLDLLRRLVPDLARAQIHPKLLDLLRRLVPDLARAQIHPKRRHRPLAQARRIPRLRIAVVFQVLAQRHGDVVPGAFLGLDLDQRFDFVRLGMGDVGDPQVHVPGPTRRYS